MRSLRRTLVGMSNTNRLRWGCTSCKVCLRLTLSVTNKVWHCPEKCSASLLLLLREPFKFLPMHELRRRQGKRMNFVVLSPLVSVKVGQTCLTVC